jgi:hypothetical protein
MKLIFSLIIIIFFSIKSYSQNSINIIASGSAFTKEKAIFSALRYALEKGAGVYISSKTIIQNDQLVFDEVASLSNGTISKYEIIESSFSEKFKEHQVTISATIEVGKFVNLIKSKGVNVAFEGASFAQNVKMHEYYKAEEPKILAHFFDQYGWEEIFQLFDKKLIADEPKLYNFKSSDFQIGLEKDWKKHRNDQLINDVRNGREVVLEINKNQFYNPFYTIFKSTKFSFRGPDFLIKQDSISGIIESWQTMFKNKKNWTKEEIANYSKSNPKDVYDWYDFTQYKLIDSMNKRFNQLNEHLRGYQGKYVINLAPYISTNQNYKSFSESFKKILLEISVNKDSNFSKSSFEEKFGPTYSIFLFEIVNGIYQKSEYVVRNRESLSLYFNFIPKLNSVFSGYAILELNAIKTNLGTINNYLSGLTLDSNGESRDFFTGENDGLIINPWPNQCCSARFLENGSIEPSPFSKHSITQFVDLESLGKIKEFTIDNPPLTYYLPIRASSFLVDKAKTLTSIQQKSLREKLAKFNSKTGVELFIVIDNNNYGFDEMGELAEQYGFEWEIGGKERKGIIFLINNKTHKMFYGYGGGIDSQLTVKFTNETLESFKPFQKVGNYFGGFTKAIDLTEAKISPNKK